MPKVNFLSSNNLSVYCLAQIAKICVTPMDTNILKLDVPFEKAMSLCKKLYERGHWSVFEHASMTYYVECSRACSLQLARHRHMSRTEMSQRYVKLEAKDECYVLPPNLDDYQIDEMIGIIYAAQKDYEYLIHNLDMKPEDARFILPEATKTRMFITLNLRTLLELTQKRANNSGAQWEIRELVRQMWNDVPENLKEVFKPELTWLKDNE